MAAGRRSATTDSEVLPFLRDALAEETGPVGAAAARALGATGRPEAEALLVKALAVDDAEVGVAPVKALATMGTAAAGTCGADPPGHELPCQRFLDCP